MTIRKKIIATIHGEITDSLLFMPRLELWYSASLVRQTIPTKYLGLTRDDISMKEGWIPYRFMPDFLDLTDPENMVHRSLGLIANRQHLCRYVFDPSIEIEVQQNQEEIIVEYRTPVGVVSSKAILSQDQKKNGGTVHVVTDHLIKSPSDYKVLSYLFRNLSVMPDYEPFSDFEKRLGDDTLCFATAGAAASPFHHILRDLVDPTTFYLHYQDYSSEMRNLAETMAGYYRQLIEVVRKSPAQAIVWGSNYDSALTYPAFFRKEMLPWIQEACQEFHKAGKMVGSHCDGENLGLMDLLYESGIDVADSVCPHPMTKIPIKEYYRRWGDKISIFGGIPQEFLLPDVTSIDDLKSYLDHFFADIAPGTRFVVGIADAVPPDAAFDRLQIIAERVEKEGRIPLRAGGFSPANRGLLESLRSLTEETAHTEPFLKNLVAVSEWVNALKPHAGAIKLLLTSSLQFMETLESSRSVATKVGYEETATSEKEEPLTHQEYATRVPPSPYEILVQDVLKGDQSAIQEHLTGFIKQGYAPEDLLHKGMLNAMEIIGERFKNGTVFIPEVLLSARALNSGAKVLEPYLAKDGNKEAGTILIGTVLGDLHDIGKNIVLTMLKGVGFNTVDLGVNVRAEDFVKRVQEDKPDILGLSSLLTTTMPEMQRVIKAVEEAGLRESVSIMVGGAPVNEQYAKKIGADGYAKDAGEAVEVARKLIQRRR